MKTALYGYCYAERTCQVAVDLTAENGARLRQTRDSDPMVLIGDCCEIESHHVRFVNGSRGCASCVVQRKTVVTEQLSSVAKTSVSVRQERRRSSPRNLDKLRGLLNSAGIYIPKYTTKPSFKQVTCVTWNTGYVVTFDKRSYRSL